MRIKNPYRNRSWIAVPVFWLVSLLLINFWVDINDFSFHSGYSDEGTSVVQYDDYDSFYEWIAEGLLGIDEALPESEEGEENNDGKFKIQNINLVYPYTALPVLPMKYLALRHAPYVLPSLTKPLYLVWSPPPNV